MTKNLNKVAEADDQTQEQALSRYTLGALILSDPVLETIRRELRRVSPDVQVDAVQIRRTLTAEVLKRKVVGGDEAVEAKRAVDRAAVEFSRAKKPSKADSADAVSEVGIVDPVIDAVETVDGMSG